MPIAVTDTLTSAVGTVENWAAYEKVETHRLDMKQERIRVMIALEISVPANKSVRSFLRRLNRTLAR